MEKVVANSFARRIAQAIDNLKPWEMALDDMVLAILESSHSAWVKSDLALSQRGCDIAFGLLDRQRPSANQDVADLYADGVILMYSGITQLQVGANAPVDSIELLSQAQRCFNLAGKWRSECLASWVLALVYQVNIPRGDSGADLTDNIIEILEAYRSSLKALDRLDRRQINRAIERIYERDERLRSLIQQLAKRNHNLYELEIQRANYGINVPLEIINNIRHEEEEICRLKREIEARKESLLQQTGQSDNQAVPSFRSVNPPELISHLRQEIKVDFEAFQQQYLYTSRRDRSSPRDTSSPIEVLPSPSKLEPIPFRIPVIDEIAAGKEKVVSDGTIGYIQAGDLKIDEHLLEIELLKGSQVTLLPEYDYFAMLVSGDSMDGAGIAPNDYVILQKPKFVPVNPDNGDIVAVVFRAEDDKATLKRFYFDKSSGNVILKPESSNPEHKPRRVRAKLFAGENPPAAIVGVAIAVLRKTL